MGTVPKPLLRANIPKMTPPPFIESISSKLLELQTSLDAQIKLRAKVSIEGEKSFNTWVFANIISLAFTVLATLDPSYPATTHILASTLATRAWIR